MNRLRLVHAAEVTKTAQHSRNVRTEYSGIHETRIAHAGSVRTAIRAATYRIINRQYQQAFVYNGAGEYVCYIDGRVGKGIQIMFTSMKARQEAAGL